MLPVKDRGAGRVPGAPLEHVEAEGEPGGVGPASTELAVSPNGSEFSADGSDSKGSGLDEQLGQLVIAPDAELGATGEEGKGAVVEAPAPLRVGSGPTELASAGAGAVAEERDGLVTDDPSLGIELVPRGPP